MDDSEQPLFYMLASAPFQEEQRVVAHTIWGDEPGKVIALPFSGWARVLVDRGFVLTVGTNRLTHEENVR